MTEVEVPKEGYPSLESYRELILRMPPPIWNGTMRFPFGCTGS